MFESSTRSLVKTLTYRVLIIISNFVITYLLTQSFDLATKVAGFTLVINLVIYYLHERIWNQIRWGKDSKKRSS